MSSTARWTITSMLAVLVSLSVAADAFARTVVSQSRATFNGAYSGVYTQEDFEEDRPTGTCDARRGSTTNKRTVTLARSGRMRVERLRATANGRVYRLEFSFAPARTPRGLAPNFPTTTRFVDSEQSTGYENYRCPEEGDEFAPGWYRDGGSPPVSTTRDCSHTSDLVLQMNKSRFDVSPFANGRRCDGTLRDPRPYASQSLKLTAKVSAAKLFSRRSLTIRAADSRTTSESDPPGAGRAYETIRRTTVSGSWTLKLRRLSRWRTKTTRFP